MNIPPIQVQRKVCSGIDQIVFVFVPVPTALLFRLADRNNIMQADVMIRVGFVLMQRTLG
jgi:hypothetical protein